MDSLDYVGCNGFKLDCASKKIWDGVSWFRDFEMQCINFVRYRMVGV